MTGQTGLNQRQKAAVIVRLLLDDDEVAGLDRLNPNAQTLLAQEMAGMELIDRNTRDAVITEFCDRLESVGVTFPGDLDGTLAMLGARLSDDSSDALRRTAAITGQSDPWVRLCNLPKESLIALANAESVELVALMLSKLPVEAASATFIALPRDRARVVAQAMSMTSGVTPAALRRVGLVLLQAAEALPKPAIATPACDRMGAILTFATADLRDDVLGALDERDMNSRMACARRSSSLAISPPASNRAKCPRSSANWIRPRWSAPWPPRPRPMRLPRSSSCRTCRSACPTACERSGRPWASPAPRMSRRQ